MSALNDLRAHLTAMRTLVKGVTRGLAELSPRDDPLELFNQWYADAEKSGLLLPESMALATATSDGVPSVRMVLLKRVDARGFRFFTNFGSRKALELDANPRGALCFYWSVLERQVRVEGSVARLSTQESDAYFRSRQRGSQIGAWASRQSRSIADRQALEARVREMEQRFADGPVPLPEHWGGYILKPTRFEFWQGRSNRLHDRFAYTLSPGGQWIVSRLQP